MKRVTNVIVWLCKIFNREQLLYLITKLQKVLDNKDPDLKPKDDFKEKHPNYRDFYVDPTPPILPEQKVKKAKKQKTWKDILAERKKKAKT